MNRLAILMASLALGACAAAASPSGPPPAGAPFGPSQAGGALGFAQGQMSGAEACPVQGEADCMLEAIWTAAQQLGPEKFDRLKPVFAETIARGADPALRARWQARLGNVRAPETTQVNFARQTAEAAIAEHGWEGFFQRARLGQPPLNMARPEIMDAAIDLSPNAMERGRLIDMMFDLSGAPMPGTSGRISPDPFERQTFAHVLAERMMRDCRSSRFDLARIWTAAPDTIRYDLWQARIEGGAGQLAGAVRRGDGTDDTRHVRQALEGYGAILALGYCQN